MYFLLSVLHTDLTKESRITITPYCFHKKSLFCLPKHFLFLLSKSCDVSRSFTRAQSPSSLNIVSSHIRGVNLSSLRTLRNSFVPPVYWKTIMYSKFLLQRKNMGMPSVIRDSRRKRFLLMPASSLSSSQREVSNRSHRITQLFLQARMSPGMLTSVLS